MFYNQYEERQLPFGMNVHGTINSLEDFYQLVEEISFRRAHTQAYGLPFRQEFYRGQLSSTWSIKSGLTRNLTSVEEAVSFEKKVLDLFKSEIEAHNLSHRIFLHQNPKGYQNEWAWIMQAQHYGIPTRFLDWTLKPEVALYFAVENSNWDNVDGQFLFLYVPNGEVKIEGGGFDEYYEVHPKDVDDTWFLNPSFYDHSREDMTAEVRRARQFGKFTMQSYSDSLLGMDEQPDLLVPWDEDLETKTIEKYIIPAYAKPQLRLDLAAKGWYGDYLYANDDLIINSIRDKCKQLLIL